MQNQSMILLVLNLFKINFTHWASSVKILIQLKTRLYIKKMSKHWLNSPCLFVHAVCGHTINFKNPMLLISEDVRIFDLKNPLVCKMSVLYKPSLIKNVLYGWPLTKRVKLISVSKKHHLDIRYYLMHKVVDYDVDGFDGFLKPEVDLNEPNNFYSSYSFLFKYNN